jgi:lipoate-protein ligase A
MFCILNQNLDPYFNIACEDYLFNKMDEDCFLLYRNESAVILGKHQNALAELNYQFVRDNNIKVVRRLSGGGAVYHDPSSAK